jgi:hypothetical protein
MREICESRDLRKPSHFGNKAIEEPSSSFRNQNPPAKPAAFRGVNRNPLP